MLERDGSGLVTTVPALRWGEEAFVYERGWERLRGLIREGLRGAGGEVPGGPEEPDGSNVLERRGQW